MNKTEIDYIKNRVEEVVRCTNGQVSTRLQERKKTTLLADEEKFQFIKDGKATLKDISSLLKEDCGYHRKWYDSLLSCYTYQKTPVQLEAEAYNQRLDNKIEEIHTEIQLEGKRIIDSVVLGIIEKAILPDELRRLGEMINLVSAQDEDASTPLPDDKEMPPPTILK